MHLDYFIGVFHIAVRQLAYMHQPILVDPDINEGTEGGNVGNDPWKFHSDLQVFHLFDTIRKAEGLKALTWVAARFGEFLKYIVERGKTDTVSDIR